MNRMPKPLALVTNDDGIDSPFLRLLVLALAGPFKVVVAAPIAEQSWVGRGMSRRQEISAKSRTIEGHAAWAIDGTPTDCVNLALGHLLAERPAVVISGLNIGYNTAVPTLFSSGTVAGALEGAHWGLPALAVSQALPEVAFTALASGDPTLPEALRKIVAASANHATEVAVSIAGEPNRSLLVHNLNYPENMVKGAPVTETAPSHVTHGPLFTREGDRTYRFRYRRGQEHPAPYLTDREALRSGAVSWSRLNFSALASSIQLKVSTSDPSHS